jgi:acyl transferase
MTQTAGANAPDHHFQLHETRAYAGGKRLVLWSLTPVARPVVGTILLGAGFGRRMSDSAALALYLCHNGFRVYRYDPLCHRGMSDGDIIDHTMTVGYTSLTAALDWICQREDSRVGVFAMSLSARLAYRLAARDRRVAFLISAAGVVHLRDTLRRVNDGVDYAGWPRSDLPPVLNIERQPVRPALFLDDARAHDWLTLEGTCADFAQIRVPIITFHGDSDPWVQLADVKRAFAQGDATARELVEMRATAHDLARNAAIARTVLSRVTAAALELAGSPSTADEPSFDGLVRRRLLESRLQREPVASEGCISP